MRRLSTVLVSAAVLALFGCGGDPTQPAPPGPPPPPPPPPPSPDVVVVDNAPVPAAGGTVSVTRADSPLRNLFIKVPAGAYPGATQWTVTERTAVRLTLPPAVRQVGSTIRIRNGAGFAAKPFVISLPVRTGRDSSLAAFFRDPESGALEPMPIVTRTDSSLVVLTRHVSATQLLATAPAASASLSAAATAPTPGEVELIVVAGATVDLKVRINSTFKPGVDDWEFANYGSFLAPGGHCVGSTLSAVHYHATRKATQGALFGRYDSLPNLEPDNPRGVRLASVIQETLDWDGGRIIAAAIASALAEAGVVVGAPAWVAQQVEGMALAMLVTGKPVLLSIYEEGLTNGHSIVAHATDAGSIFIADPNDPGVEHSIGWSSQGVAPFLFSDNAAEAARPYLYLFPIGLSGLIPMRDFDARWAEFDAGTIGDGLFKPVIREYRDPVDTLWRPVTNLITTASSRLTVRTLCPACLAGRGNAALEPDRVLTQIYNASGGFMSDDVDDLADGADFALFAGDHRYGLLSSTFPDDPDYDEWSYHDYRWFRVKTVEFTLAAVPANPAPGDDVLFTVTNGGIGDPTARYRWSIGDEASVTTPFDTRTLRRILADPSGLTVRVELLDAQGHPLARAAVRFGPRWVSVARGINVACGITDDHSLYCWGTNGFGEAGTGTQSEVAFPTRVVGTQQWAQVDTYAGHTCAVTVDGQVWCWGVTVNAGVGPVPTVPYQTTPVRVPGLPPVKSVTVGNWHSCAVTTVGEAYCWGPNSDGQLGLGTFTTREFTPRRVVGGQVWKTLTAGAWFTCGVTTGGVGYCWGDDNPGRGTGGSTKLAAPTPILGGHSFATISISGVSSTCGVTPQGSGVCWGSTSDLPTNATSSTVPAPTVMLTGRTWASATPGGCALDAAGQAFCFGLAPNSGTGGSGSLTAPTPVLGGHRFTQLSRYQSGTCGVATTGRLYCWGSGSGGRNGNGSSALATAPVPVRDPD